MRYRVDLLCGYASFDEKDVDKAMELYKAEGLRLLKCKDIFDEGTVLEGIPLGVDIKARPQA